MAKPSKIETLGCQEIVWAGVRDEKPVRKIAEECSEWAGEKISHTAVAKYVKEKGSAEQAAKKEVIKAHQRRILKTVNQELDIIQTNLDATKRLIERFELVDDLPNMFKEQMDELIDKLVGELETDFNHVKYLENWQLRFEDGLRRKVSEIAILNREVRENMKFLVNLREKAFQFELVSNFVDLFMDIFKEESKDGAYERAVIRIASNPRMKQLSDQLKAFKSDAGGGE